MRRFMQNLDELSGLDMVALSDHVPISGEATWSMTDRTLAVDPRPLSARLFAWLGFKGAGDGRCPADAEQGRPSGERAAEASPPGF